MAEADEAAGAGRRRAERRPFVIGDNRVKGGTRARFELPVARLPTGSWLNVPVIVIHGATPGPTLWLSAAIHGDELNGIEIIRRVNTQLSPRGFTGTLLAVPVVNAFGLVTASRYLPDRRDLNRSFPGSARGSLAARLAHMLMTTIVKRCEVGIDLHTGSDNRENLPQIRADLSDEETLSLAQAFGAPVCLDSRARDGSLRDAATRRGARVLLYEAGQADRFDEPAIRVGVEGILRVLSCLGMWNGAAPPASTSMVSWRSHWTRASRSGVFRPSVELGDRVTARQTVGTISDTFGTPSADVHTRATGIVIALNRHPMVHRGDALLHVAAENGSPASPAPQA